MNNKITFFDILKKFLLPLRENKKLFRYSIIYFLLDAFVNIWLLFFFKEVVDSKQWYLNIYFYLFVLFIFIKFFIIIYYRNFYWFFNPEIRKYLYWKYLQEYLEFDNNKSELHWTWKVISIIEKSNFAWLDQLVNFFRDFISWILNIFFALFIIFSINSLYWIFILVLVVLVFYITVIVQRINKKYRVERREYNIDISKKIVNLIISKFEVLQNNKWKSEIEKIVNVLNWNIRVNKEMSNNDVYLNLFINFIIYWVRVFIIVIFVYWYDKWLISIWEFSVYISFSYILEKTLLSFSNAYLNFSNNLIDIEKVWEFFDWKSKMVGYNTWSDFKYEKWNFNIKNLGFSYDEWKKVFDDFNLDIEWWKVIAFVWNSWSWKSTLMKLISWYIRQNKWNIFVDWQDLSIISLKSYYKNIWYLTQDPSVFDWKIYDNLTYSSVKLPSIDEINKVIKLAKCEFIYDLPKGLETEIWERWVKLSGWQKQRLAIAKIMLKNPHIIFLDEPTSAMDSFNEEYVSEAMQNLFIWKTVIIIAHRLQTVKHADRIIYIENWKIVEDWTHVELVKLNGKYKKMLDLQSGF